VKPPPFTYVQATTLAEATSALAQFGEDASVLAGGQSLIPLLNMRLARPEVLIDINGLRELAYIRPDSGGVRIGATTRAHTAEHDRLLHERVPLVGTALAFVGHPQIRRRTTIGGNLAHADPSSELPGVVAALDGEVVLSSARGDRVLRWDEFFLSVFTTARQPDELVTELRLPADDGWRFGFDEFAARHGDFPIVALAAGVRVRDDGQLDGVRLAATGVGECVVRLRAAEALGRGEPTEVLVEAVAEAAAAEVTPTADSAGSTEYRRSVLRTLVRRTLAQLTDPAAGGPERRQG
jgi:carbon-monoxide dehydrogenase medium subunit